MAFKRGHTFDHYSSSELSQAFTQLAGGLGGNVPTIAAGGRNSTNSLRNTAGAGGGTCASAMDFIGSSGATAIIQWAFKHTGAFTGLTMGTNDAPGNTSSKALLIRQGSSTQVWVRINTNGTISVYRGTTLLGTTTDALQAGVYAYIKIKVVINSSTGTVDVSINGASSLSLTSQNTQSTGSATWDEYGLGGISGTSVTWDFDDVMVMDGSGSAYNDFVDDHQGLYVPADGEGNHTDGTPSSGADRAAMVDEASADGDTSYNTKDTAAQKDSFTLSTWPASGGIGPIQVVAQARKEDAGGANIELGVRVSSTDHDGTAQGLTTSYAFYREVFEENPETTAAWAAGAAPELIDHKET